MRLIHLTSFIQSPPDRLFNLSLSVDLHKFSMKLYKEQVFGTVTSGQLNLNDTVTWKAKHLLKDRFLKIKITQLKAPDYFVEEQVQGSFSLMKHEHYFKPIDNGTLMIDQFRYETKFGKFGKIFNRLYLEKYLTRVLTQRNNIIKKVAESEQWKQFLNK